MQSLSKEKVYAFCQKYVVSKVTSVQQEIEKLNEALRTETKSTAGDKHETGRAMIQLEREKLGKQLLEAEKMKLIFERIPKTTSTTSIGLGSLVQTDRATYFISISAGIYKGNGEQVFCISASSPIGKLLLGKTEGDTLLFKGQTSKIVNVL